MPIQIRDLDGGLGNIITGKGDVEEQELFEALRKHLTQDKDKFKKYKYSLSDYSALQKFNISTKNIEQIANYCKISSEVNHDAVVAVVAGRDLIYGLARMWERLVDGTGWEIKIFRNRKDAEVWIKDKAKEKHGIADITFE